MNKTITYEKVLREVEYILQQFPKEIQNKIPNDFRNTIVKKMDVTYIPEPYNKNKTLDEQNISEETKKILALIYRNYLVSDEERKKLITEENNIREKLENEKRKKYGAEDIFNNKTNNSQNINSNADADKLIIKSSNNKKWYKKLIEKILNFFNK
jgi:hypothetical protein